MIIVRSSLLAAALAAASTPALAQDIQEGETCQVKIPTGGFFLCGAVPADGHIAYTNTGIHKVTVFTTGPDGTPCQPGDWEIDGPNSVNLKEKCGALQVDEGLLANASSQTDVEANQQVWIARDDETFSWRTIAVKFTEAPPNVDLGDASRFSDTRMFVEFNATTEDVGIRASLDGEPWDAVRIIGPDQRILQASRALAAWERLASPSCRSRPTSSRAKT